MVEERDKVYVNILSSAKFSSSIRIRGVELNTINREKAPFTKIELFPQTGIIALVDEKTGEHIVTSVANLVYGVVIPEEVKEEDVIRLDSEGTEKEDTPKVRGESDRSELPKTKKRNKR